MEEKADKKKRSNIKNNSIRAVGVTLLLVAVLLLIIFLINGETTVTGGFPESESVSSLNCVASNSYLYPFFEYDNSNSKSTEINAIFEDDKLKSIALIVILNYSDSNKIKESEAVNHAAMNKSFSAAGLKADAFSSLYSKLSGSFKYSIYALAEDIYDNGGGSKYFLLDEMKESPFGMSETETALKKKGLNCTLKNKI